MGVFRKKKTADDFTPGETFHPNRIRAGVRSRATTEITALHFAGQPEVDVDRARVPTRAIAADLVWCAIWDSPQTMSPINQGHLDDWGLSFDEVLQTGMTNLAQEPIEGWRSLDERVFAVIGVDDYSGSRVLLANGRDFIPFEGELVIFNPTRMSCIVASASDEQGVKLAAELCLREVEEPNQVSFTPIVGSEGNWRPLELDESHPAYTDWRTLTTLDAAYGYDGQKQLLENVLGDDIYVGSLEVVEPEEGRVTSMCTWSPGVPTLLPHADEIVFFSPETKSGPRVQWSQAKQVVGHLMEPTDFYPPRTRVLKFPTDAELERLTSIGTPL